MKNKKIIGVIEISIGGLLASPLDETAVATTTAGVSLPTAPAQAIGTGILGTLLILDGFRRITK